MTAKKQIKTEKKEDSENEKLTIFNHELIPLHRVLNEEETIKLLSKYNITKSSLPKISKKDPCVKSLKSNPGDVLEITRNSVTAGETKYYRVVVID